MQIENELISQANSPLYGRIYRLTNKINGKMYHGQTIKDVNKRWNRYKRLNCKGQKKLYPALKKYGPENFLFEVIDTSSQNQSQLDNQEIFYIAKFDSFHNGYNCTKGGNGVRIASEETKRKISESKKGKIGLSGSNHPMFGKNHSEETKRKISEGCKGEKHSDEFKAKMSERMKGENNPMFGIPMPEKTRKILSNTNKGNKYSLGNHHSEEAKKKISEAFSGENNPFFGKHHSKETKRKISDARKLYHQRKRELLAPLSPSGLDLKVSQH